MSFEYKTESLLHYIGKGPGKGAGFGAGDALGSIWEQSKKIADVVEHCLNHYAADGWQFMRLVELSSDNLSSVGGMLAKGALSAVLGKSGGGEISRTVYPLVIFRREVGGSATASYSSAARATDANQLAQRDVVKQEVINSVHIESPTNSDMPKEKQLEMESYGITFDGEKYVYQAYKYDLLRDAIAYAKKQQGN